MTDNYGNGIEPGDEIVYTYHGVRYVGTVEWDSNYRGGMRVGGRSIEDIRDHADDIKVIS